MQPLAVHMRGTSLGETALERDAKAKAAKICKDYHLPESVCAGLVECIKQGSVRQCFEEVVAAMATGGCATLPGGTWYAGFCGAIARWLASKIGFVGTVTTPGCQIAPRRYVTTPEPIVRVQNRAVGGHNVQHWDVQWHSATDFNTLLLHLNPGEYAQIWPTPAPTDDGVSTSRVSIIPMFYTGCDQSYLDQHSATYDAEEIQTRLRAGYGSVPLTHAAFNRWSSPNVLAVRDWDGTYYKVNNYDAPYWLWNGAKRTNDYKLVPVPPPTPTTSMTLAIYPEGSVAIFDSSINKYRVLAPA